MKVTKVRPFPVREWGAHGATWWHSSSTVQYQVVRIIALLQLKHQVILTSVRWHVLSPLS